MKEILLRFLLLWLAIFAGLIVISFILNWDVFVQYFSEMVFQLISSIVIMVILIGAMIYLISLLFRW